MSAPSDDFDAARNGCISWGGVNKWYKDGLLHRGEDLPAIECDDGTKAWYKNGKCHRGGKEEPAIVWPSGRKSWYKRGVCQKTFYPAANVTKYDSEQAAMDEL